MNLLVSSIVGGVNEQKSIVNKNAFQLDAYRPLQWPPGVICPGSVCLGGVCPGGGGVCLGRQGMATEGGGVCPGRVWAGGVYPSMHWGVYLTMHWVMGECDRHPLRQIPPGQTLPLVQCMHPRPVHAGIHTPCPVHAWMHTHPCGHNS